MDRHIRLLSVVTPAFNQAASLEGLYERIASVLRTQAIDWEWIVVDDHSSDSTAGCIARLAARDPRVRAMRLARPHGLNTAVLCGMDAARGECVALLAGDSQDPPEALPDMVRQWRRGADVVWAVRADRSRSGRSGWFSRLHRLALRRLVGVTEIAAEAVFFLADRRVVDTVRAYREQNIAVFTLLGWLGFRQEAVEYSAPAPRRDPAVLPLVTKIDVLTNSITPFSDMPLRAGLIAGAALLAIAVASAAAAFLGISIGPLSPGWILLFSAIVGVGALNLLLLGVVGIYLWRAVETSPLRPRYIVEERWDAETAARAPAARTDADVCGR